MPPFWFPPVLLFDFILKLKSIKLKLTKYLVCAVIVVPSDLFVGPSPRTTISSFVLSICPDELLSTSVVKKVNENQIQYHIQKKNIYMDLDLLLT